LAGRCSTVLFAVVFHFFSWLVLSACARCKGQHKRPVSRSTQTLKMSAKG